MDREVKPVNPLPASGLKSHNRINMSFSLSLDSLDALISAAVQLGAELVNGWSDEERRLVRKTTAVAVPLDKLRDLIASGADPLGEAYCRIRNGDERTR
jgi:hypothetical protein